MQKRTLKVALLAVLTTVLLFGISTTVLADQTWSDLPDTVTAKYGITDNQVAAISEGYAGGVWKPFQNVTRAQFTKMAVMAFDISLLSPVNASFTDVAKGSLYYPYIEGAKAAGAVNGTTPTTFSPNSKITRQQAIAIVSRYVAKVQGFDLATMYTAEEITHILSHFGDANSISANLRTEVAFAYDVGITKGDDYGNVNPQSYMTRIQGAAFLIRAQELVPPQLWIPANIELVSEDKSENLVGQVHTATFEVTTADGHPAIGVLVDFDTLYASDYYVGNISPEAAVTDSTGRVTASLISAEPGTQRVSATVAGVGTIYTTKYWLALDEVYTIGDPESRNNAGTPHEWSVRVVVFGPGPRSTSQNDWYNIIDASFDPLDVDEQDGVDWNCYPYYRGDYWTYADELSMAGYGFVPRTMAGIEVEWSIYDVPDNPLTKLTDESIASVGEITAVDGVAITPAKEATGHTDADGYSKIKIESTETGVTLTQAVATYPEHPYPKQLVYHEYWEGGLPNQWHDWDWVDQPVDAALQVKTWIPHTMGDGEDGPISPAYQAPNIGEEVILTITLTDIYGNPVAGKQVEWFMQGVGFFQTDDAGDTSDPDVAANNKDFDVTDVEGKATVFVKSYDAGEQIVHAKVRDKGTGGSEGAYTIYTGEVQWFDVDIVTFDDITTYGGLVWDYDLKQYLWVDRNEALSVNPVDDSHTFDLWVYGLKLEYCPTVDEPDGQTPYIDSDAPGDAYDGIVDYKDADYFGGILMYPYELTYELLLKSLDDKIRMLYEVDPVYGEWYHLPFDWNANGVIEASITGFWLDLDPFVDSGAVGGVPGVDIDAITDNDEDLYVDDERGIYRAKVCGVWLTLSFEGAYTMYDWDDDGYKEPFLEIPGIYLPLEGKDVTFSLANQTDEDLSNLGAPFEALGILNDFAGPDTTAVGDFSPNEAVTDANGMASVTVTSTEKGPETVRAVVDWAGNPHNGPELLSAYAKKLWVAGAVGPEADVTIEVYIDGELVASSDEGEVADGWSAMWETDTVTGDLYLNSAHVEVHVLDAYGNDLADYEVVYLLENIGEWLIGSQDAADTYIPLAYLVDEDVLNDDLGTLVLAYDQNGDRPDADEPEPGSDPYSYIVGPGGTWSFFFNQWLGSEKPTFFGQPGVRAWWTRISGMGFLGYYGYYEDVWYALTWPVWLPDPHTTFDGFDGRYDGWYYPEYLDPVKPPVGLATDGAKAWTLDGYMYEEGPGSNVVPNLLTGSNIDIQLAEAPEWADHVKSILRIMVYEPADGIVTEGSYIWSTQVHQVWEPPVPTTITLDPTYQVKAAGYEPASIGGQVLDQFGEPMPGIEVDITTVTLEEGGLTDPGLLATTGPDGQFTVTWSQGGGDWGVQVITASVDGLVSNQAVIDWALNDRTSDTYVDGRRGGNTVVAIAPGFAAWDGLSMTVHLTPTGPSVNNGTFLFDVLVNTYMDLTYTFAGGMNETFWVYFAGTDTDNAPNWVLGQTETGALP